MRPDSSKAQYRRGGREAKFRPQLARTDAAQGESPVTPTKLLIGQILIVFAIIVLGVWAATQWAASMLAYQPQLGAPWFTIRELPIYRPWALFGWWRFTRSNSI